MDELELELKQGFLEEAAQLLGDTEQCFLDLEGAQDPAPLLEKIFRLAHNLKGSARAVGFGEMGEFTHQLESLLLKLKNKELPIHGSTVSLLLSCNDHLRRWVEVLQKDLGASFPSQDLLNSIREHLEGRADTAGVEKQFSNEVAPLVEASIQEVIPEATEVPMEAQAIVEPEISGSAISALELTNPEPAAPIAPQLSKQQPAQAAADESIRVSLKRLEKLMNNVGELVILQTVLHQQRHQIESTLVQKTIGQLSKITKDIQGISMGLRMVPLKATFQKMQRIVRDSSNALGKEIQLVISGEETELDKTVVDHLGDPLVHLIRNAVDHGIESTEERKNTPKDKVGTISLNAFHEGGQMVIEIKDDGRGLDAKKLVAKAREKGILRVDQQISDAEAYQLIFAPSFSTKAEVTEISGRGVGMDVVKTNIEKVLKGSVQLQTELGKGTTFRIVLPLTLAIIDGMVVEAFNERYIVPLSQIHESVRPRDGDVKVVSGVGEMLNLRGEVMQMFRLAHLLGRAQEWKSPDQGIAVVCRSDSKAFALWVDDLIGQQQVVIKNLGAEVRHVKGISGGAILGDGKAALILDLSSVVQSYGSKIRPIGPQASLKGVAS